MLTHLYQNKYMSEFILKYFEELWVLTLEMAPWLVLGLIFAGILKVWFPQDKVQKHLGNPNTRSAVNASILGIPLPLCSCGVIPTGISFYKNGASKGATNSFLISTPQTGVDSILATYSLMGWPFAILRPIIAFLTGIAGGIITNKTEKKTVKSPKTQFTFSPPTNPYPTNSALNTPPKFVIDNSQDTCNDNTCSGTPAKPQRNAFSRILHYAFIEMLSDIAKWLFVGLLLAALIAVVIPDDFFSNYIGSGLLEILIILAASVPLYICATGSIPIATVLLLKGVSPGAAIVFLMAGPATNIATITVIGNAMGKRSLMAYLGSIIGGAIISGVLVNEFLPKEWLLGQLSHAGNHHENFIPYWLMLASSILLIAFMLNTLFQWLKAKYAKVKTEESQLVLVVDGMTCNHCKNSVEKNISALNGVQSVTVNLANKTVVINGTVSPEKIRQTITQLGFKIIDK
ncbi:heavy metal-associated domain-containing protein [Prolixibacteraceae bacterium JC049]|nr:heavy metal-associated domain-containing protein [Prolixibacteraceae bacterium JC049]